MLVRNIIITFLLITKIGLVHSQGINESDKDGKKHGRWIVYLDEFWAKCDSSKALYKRFTVYDHGINLYPMGTCGSKGWTLKGNVNSGSGISILDGEYSWYDKQSRIFSTHVLQNGNYVDYKEFFTDGKLQQHFEYLKRYQDQENTWLITIYSKKGTVKQQLYMVKDAKGRWPMSKD